MSTLKLFEVSNPDECRTQLDIYSNVSLPCGKTVDAPYKDLLIKISS